MYSNMCTSEAVRFGCLLTIVSPYVASVLLLHCAVHCSPNKGMYIATTKAGQRGALIPVLLL